MAYILSYLERRSGFVVRKVGEAHMVVPTGARMKEYRGMITINETGAFLFDQIKTRRSTKELIDALIAEYGIDETLAFEAIETFVDQCNFANLLVSEEVEQLPQGQMMYMKSDLREQLDLEEKERREQNQAQRMDELRERLMKKTGKTLEEYVNENKDKATTTKDGKLVLNIEFDDDETPPTPETPNE